jgi:hypothetical protein
MSASSLDLDVIRHPIIKTAIVAMNSRNKKQWYALFSDNPALTDDGNSHDFTEWWEKELFGSNGISGLN